MKSFVHPIALSFLVLFVQTLKAQEPIFVSNATVSRGENCTFTPDFSNTENGLRSAIFTADLELAASYLDSDDVFSLGAGLTYPPELTCFFETKSADRTKDPDIVAIQALALSAERTNQTFKLAVVTVYSFDLREECDKCPLFTAQDLDDMFFKIKALFDDPEERAFILNFTGEEEAPEVEPLRRLYQTESSPTDSDFCAHCDPHRSCNGNVHWCAA